MGIYLDLSVPGTYVRPDRKLWHVCTRTWGTYERLLDTVLPSDDDG